MLTTEDQAREKWCPMVRIARREYAEPGPYMGEGDAPMVTAGCNTDALGGNRVPASCRCIASECAMWRWKPTGKIINAGIEAIRVAGGRVVEQVKWEPKQPTQGYCGLAGRPESAA